MSNQPASSVDLGFDREDVKRLLEYEMPFGRFEGMVLIDLPEEYLLWFENQGFPSGTLGRLMSLCLGIKRFGAEQAVKSLREPMTADGNVGKLRS